MQIHVVIIVALILGLTSCGLEAQSVDEKPAKKTPEKTAEKESAETLALRAQALFKQGKYDAADKVIVEALKTGSDSLPLQMLAANLRFIKGDVEAAIENYDQVIKLRPEYKPYLWQRGLALYYAKEFETGKAQFETHQTVNSQDVENAVWHLLCASKIDNLEAARKKLIPISGDTRIPMSQIYELFAGRMQPDEVLKVADANKGGLAQYYAHLYIGLYHEMLGDKEASKQSIAAAIRKSQDTKDNLMLQLARIHRDLRNHHSNSESEKAKPVTPTEKSDGKKENTR